MKRSVLLTLTTIVALAVPAVAGAKEISKLELCGAESCNTINGWTNVKRFVSHGESMSTTAAPPGPHYRVTMTAKHEEGTESWTIFYVPAGGKLALNDGAWEQLPAGPAAAYRKATAGLEPLPAPTLERVVINGREVDDPSSYLALYTAGSTKEALPTHLTDWVLVDMRFRGETPWSGDPVFFSTSDGLLQRGIEIVRIPDEMAADVRAGNSLAPGDPFPWLLAAAIALILALLAGGGLWLAFRRESVFGARRAPIPT